MWGFLYALILRKVEIRQAFELFNNAKKCQIWFILTRTICSFMLALLG